jgi:hypothetical protein
MQTVTPQCHCVAIPVHYLQPQFVCVMCWGQITCTVYTKKVPHMIALTLRFITERQSPI